MFKEIFDNVREKCPLIHNITNYVTVNDCANVVLACGASPIMADDKDEVSDIQTICGGLNKEHLELLKGTGVDGIAVVSALFAADDIEKAAEELKEAVKKVL